MWKAVLGALVLTLMAVPGRAQTDDPTAPVYRTPPAVLANLVEAPRAPSVSAGPGGETLLLMELPNYLSVADLARPELRLAGRRIDPSLDGPSRQRLVSKIELLSVADGTTRAISGLPEPLRIEDARWSPDGRWIAATRFAADGIELWLVDVSAASAKKLLGPPSHRLHLAGWDVGPKWLPGSDGLVVALTPEGFGSRAPAPTAGDGAGGPVIQESIARTAPARTYQDLLETPRDETLFEHHFTARLARVSLDGAVTPLGEPGIFLAFDPSPDGRFVLTETLHRPFSYLVPGPRFPNRIEIWDAATGERVTEVHDLPLHEEVPIAFGSVAPGPRNHGWRADAPATLTWAEALDGGDAGAPADERDRLLALDAPFTAEPRELVRTATRYGGTTWGRDDLALVSEWWWPTRTMKLIRIRPGQPGSGAETVFEYSWEDSYNNPGSPVTEVDARGRDVLASRGETVWLIGEGASPQGNRPFLDELDLATGESERLFRSAGAWYEVPSEVLDSGDGDAAPKILVRRESVDAPPNYFVLDVAALDGPEPTAGGSDADREPAFRRLTDFPDPTPQLRGIQKELIRYTRDDGVQLSGTLYLPQGYDPATDGPLPTLLWAYPEEFKSADAAGQVTDSPYRFSQIQAHSSLAWVARGYAVLDDPSMPIIGEADEEPNDTFIEQLVSSAAAAIDELVRRGVTDPRRVAVGGHSYGAFMTAHLLAHSDLFAAGIARSGAYNRTLTPFGFQSEERTLWQATDLYVRMSPFLHAEKIAEPILLIHGAADNNPGTFPMQSERFYGALKGLGGTARLVMLPHESHGYRGEESILHMLWETDRWLETYVKNRPAEDSGDTPASP
jgi:dipeptidyl aminopeptidase/acylaminoacyl peptidase